MTIAEGRNTGREDRLLRSTVRLARLVLDSHAASVFLAADEDALVLRATSEEDADQVLGLRLPSHEGIAGWVFTMGTPAVVSGVSDDVRFARDVAELSGYLPNVIVAVPVLLGLEPVGVIEVLDPGDHGRDDLTVIDIVTEIAEQLAEVLALVRQETSVDVETAIHQAQSVLDGLSQTLRQTR